MGQTCPWVAGNQVPIEEFLMVMTLSRCASSNAKESQAGGGPGEEWDFAVVLMTRDDEKSGFTSAKHNMVVSLSRGALGTVPIMSESVTKGKSDGDRILAKFFKSTVDQGDIWTPDKKFFQNYCIVCCNSHKADKCKGVARKAQCRARAEVPFSGVLLAHPSSTSWSRHDVGNLATPRPTIHHVPQSKHAPEMHQG